MDQRRVDELFDREAAYWRDVYADRGVMAEIFRERQARALAWVDERVPSGGTVLEVGSGAGGLTVRLAQRGFRVTAVDASAEMVRSTAAAVDAEGLAGRVAIAAADVHALGFAGSTFDAVVALGVLPWLHHPERAVEEMARVLRPGGALVVTSDNRHRLNYLLDPKENPALAGARSTVKRGLVAAGLRMQGPEPPAVVNHLVPNKRLDDWVSGAGLTVVRSAGIGFGPFTFWARPMLSESRGLRAQSALQRRADRDGWQGTALRRAASQHLVLAVR